jgi:hypothetical protein
LTVFARGSDFMGEYRWDLAAEAHDRQQDCRLRSDARGVPQFMILVFARLRWGRGAAGSFPEGLS